MPIFDEKDKSDSSEDSFAFITDVSTIGTLNTDSQYSTRQNASNIINESDAMTFKNITKKIVENST